MQAGDTQIQAYTCNHDVSEEHLLVYDKNAKCRLHTLRPRLREQILIGINNWNSWLSGKKLNLKSSLQRACREPRGINVGNLLKRVKGSDGEAGGRRAGRPGARAQREPGQCRTFRHFQN